MIPELGSFAIILALCFALIQGVAPLFNNAHKNQLSKTAAYGQLIFLCFAMLCLILSFITTDLTVIYVRDHSHQLLPLLYRIGAAWGGHEGSLLLWCLILASWTVAFIFFADSQLASLTKSQIVMVLGFISSGFITFLFATSNPFQRDFPSQPIVGNDLTPILQDPGLIFHPPMLYLGYVGFAIGFAFAISALLQGKLDKTWAAACRPWIILPWSFLSCGIVLGSWWAYRELGWGGWWFWDPVENASLLPWLSATALIHSLIVCEKRETFKGWALLLAIVTFTLSLLGTFLVRSGVLVSVHTFANDPSRGVFLLAYLALIIGSAFLLYAIKINRFYKAPQFALFSRETFLLLNSVLLLTAVVTIVIGTLYPIILDALDYGKISVGEPYFNTVFIPLILPILFLMGFAPHVHWQEHSFKKVLKKLNFTLLASFLLALIGPWILGFDFHLLAACGIFFAVWIILATSQYTWQVWKPHHSVSLRHWSMIIAHIGIAITALGITVSKSYSEERQVKILPHDTVTLAGYQFTFASMSESVGPNYKSIVAKFDVKKNNHRVDEIFSQQRIYTSNQQTLSKPGILVNPWRDLYLALGNSFPDGGWAIRLYYKPLVRFIWFGGFLLMLGGFFSLLDYWKKRGSQHVA
ncbi:MAG: heme lyase CcmF/NrfE family subunit [Gammaproteobacteria bacterium]